MPDDRKKSGSAEFNKLILSQLKPRIGRETAKLLQDLADDTQSKIESTSIALDKTADYSTDWVNCVGKREELMVGWVDQIFDNFQQLQFEFNQTTQRQDLLVHVDRPALVQEIVLLRNGDRQTVQFFRGVLCTTQWALVVRGQNEMIEVFIIPTQSISTLTFKSEVARLLVMVPHRNAAGQFCWRIESDVVSWEDLRTFSKQLFGCLVKLAKGELELTTNADASFPLVPKAPVAAPVSGSEALEKLRAQTAHAAQQSSQPAPTTTPAAPPMDRATADTLQALLERKRKQNEIQKMTGRTKNRFKQKFSETLEKPET